MIGSQLLQQSPQDLARRQVLTEFAKAVYKDRYASETTRYMGTILQGFKAGVVKRQAPLRPASFMQTKKTWRACKGCHAGRTVMIEHVTGQVSERKCHACKGTGMVFG